MVALAISSSILAPEPWPLEPGSGCWCQGGLLALVAQHVRASLAAGLCSTFTHALCSGSRFGGARRDRTADLLHAMQALSQLSYGPNLTA
jgi:hypothetical protein